MASNLSMMLHRVAAFLDIDPHSLAIGWTLFVIIAVVFLIFIFSREDESEKRRKRHE